MPMVMDACQRHGRTLYPEKIDCPDCVAEARIRRAEVMQGQPTSKRISLIEDLLSPDFKGRAVGSSVIIAADLGDMIDAIIIEHRGSVERIITNLDNPESTFEMLLRISDEIIGVSQSLRATRDQERQPSNCLVDLDASPELLRAQPKSIPDLIELVDAAAQQLGCNPKTESVKAMLSEDASLQESNTSSSSPHSSTRGSVKKQSMTTKSSTQSLRCRRPDSANLNRVPDTSTRRETKQAQISSQRGKTSTPLPEVHRTNIVGSASIRPSSISKGQPKQGTFAQPWIKELAKEAALQERMYRRARLAAASP